MSKGVEMSVWKETVFKMFLDHKLKSLGREVSEKDLKYLVDNLYNDVNFNIDLNEVIEDYAEYLMSVK